MNDTVKLLLQPLENEINIYDDYNTAKKGEQNYIVVTEVANVPSQYANGKVLKRRITIDIDLFTDKANRPIFMSKLELALQDISYQKINVGYMPELFRYQSTYTFYLE